MDGINTRDDGIAQMSYGMNPSGAVPRGVRLTSKVIAEVQELHDRAAKLEHETGGRGRRARHDLRGAREEESDLLRVLGFESYGQFALVVAETDAAGLEGPEAEVADDEGAAAARDAQQTEAGLLSVLRNLNADAAGLAVDDDDADVVDEIPAPDDTTSAGPAVDAGAALVEATRELRSLGEVLRQERAEITALGVRSRADAEEILECARIDAQRIRAEAAAEARAMLEEARTAAVALTRNAIVTVDGLHRIAAENSGAADQ
jgi:hypothetical protein